MRALLCGIDRMDEVTINDDLEDYYRLIGCASIEMLRVKAGGSVPVMAVVDEEGKLNDSIAEGIIMTHSGRVMDFIHGKFILTGLPDSDGNLTDIPESAYDALECTPTPSGNIPLLEV